MDARSATPDSLAPTHLVAEPVATGVAILFPGQGSQTDDMRDLVAEHRPDLLERATEACGNDPFERIADGTAFAQPAMYAASMAAWERAGRPEAVVMAGHSLGELAALAAAGSMDLETGLDVAVERGRIMQRAAEDAPAGGMLAVLGDEEATRELAVELELTIANHNAPGQLVLSGPMDRIKAAATAARARKLKSMRLPIPGAFHSRSMAAAVGPFREVLDGVDLVEPRVPVYSCTTAGPFGDVREELAEALVRPVEWTETLEALRQAGADRFVEPGPGRVLTGLVKRTLPDAEAVALEAQDG